jgi:hypothetical protein
MPSPTVEGRAREAVAQLIEDTRVEQHEGIMRYLAHLRTLLYAGDRVRVEVVETIEHDLTRFHEMRNVE